MKKCCVFGCIFAAIAGYAMYVGIMEIGRYMPVLFFIPSLIMSCACFSTYFYNKMNK